MQIEDQVLSRLEAVLAEAEGNKDNHNGSGGGTPTPFGLYERERNLYNLLINLYRTSGNEAKRQLQDTLRLLAAFRQRIPSVSRAFRRKPAFFESTPAGGCWAVFSSRKP